MKKQTFLEVFAVVSFFLMLGFVGALENDLVPFGIGTARITAALAVFAVSTHFLTKENRPGKGTSQRR